MSTGIENGQVEAAAIIGRYGDPILVGIERLPLSALDVIVFAVHVPVVGHPWTPGRLEVEERAVTLDQTESSTWS